MRTGDIWTVGLSAGIKTAGISEGAGGKSRRLFFQLSPPSVPIEISEILDWLGMSCVDGSCIARINLMVWRGGRVQSCVRPVGAVCVTAGPDGMHG